MNAERRKQIAEAEALVREAEPLVKAARKAKGIEKARAVKAVKPKLIKAKVIFAEAQEAEAVYFQRMPEPLQRADRGADALEHIDALSAKLMIVSKYASSIGVSV